MREVTLKSIARGALGGQRRCFSTAWDVFGTLLNVDYLLSCSEKKFSKLLMHWVLRSSEARGSLLVRAKVSEKGRTLPRIHPKFIRNPSARAFLTASRRIR